MRNKTRSNKNASACTDGQETAQTDKLRLRNTDPELRFALLWRRTCWQHLKQKLILSLKDPWQTITSETGTEPLCLRKPLQHCSQHQITAYTFTPSPHRPPQLLCSSRMFLNRSPQRHSDTITMTTSHGQSVL
ncbi:hypothetical protein MHYP_G00302970 [Metynnis hypsauchen]